MLMKPKHLCLFASTLFFVSCGSTQLVETDPDNVAGSAIVETPAPSRPDGLKAKMAEEQALKETFTSTTTFAAPVLVASMWLQGGTERPDYQPHRCWIRAAEPSTWRRFWLPCRVGLQKVWPMQPEMVTDPSSLAAPVDP